MRTQKQDIIEKTREIIDESKRRGEDLSLNALLQKLNVSKGSFYYHFKNKDDLLYQAISPIIKKHAQELAENIKSLELLRDKFHLLFNVFTGDDFEQKLVFLERFYVKLLSSKNGDDGVFKKLHNEIKKSRIQLLLQALKSSGVKIDKKTTALVEYMETTMMFYYLYHKALSSRNPRSEICLFIDTMCGIFEKQSKK